MSFQQFSIRESGSQSAPVSPQKIINHTNNILDLESNYQEQLSIFQAENETLGIALKKANARLKAAEERLASARRSNQDLAKTLATVLEKMHKADSEAKDTKARLADVEAQLLRLQQHIEDKPLSEDSPTIAIKDLFAREDRNQCENQYLDTDMDMPPQLQAAVAQPFDTPVPSQQQPLHHISINHTSGASQRYHQKLPACPPLPLVPSFADDNHQLSTRSCYSSILTGRTTTNTKKSSVRITYKQFPVFCEIRDAYRSVLTAHSASEDPIVRWVRTIMSNQSAINSNPKEIESMMKGLKQLFDENGMILPLHKISSCSYQLGKCGGKMHIKIINGQLMVRAGSSYTDIFTWLERQPVVE